MRKEIFILVFTFVFFLQMPLHSMGDDYYDVREKLSSALFELINSENPEEFAAKHGIEIKESRILVVIEGFENFSEDFEDRYDLRDAKQYKNLIEVWILIEDLNTMVKDSQVKFIRRPYKFFKWR